MSAILERAGAELEKLGVKYFIGAVDRQQQDPTGGTVHSQSDIQGEDMQIILDACLPTRADAVNLGIWLGNIIKRRLKDGN